MATFLPVASFFSHVYLVDLSPSLCDIARQRFERLGWKNIIVICQDARSFHLPDDRLDQRNMAELRADAITMSYSLSMIPGQYYGSALCSKQQLTKLRLLQRCRLIVDPTQGNRKSRCLRFLR